MGWWQSLTRYNKAFAAFVILDVALLTVVVIQPRSPGSFVTGTATPPTARPTVLNIVPAPTVRPTVTASPVAAGPSPNPVPTPTPKPTPTPSPIPYEVLTNRAWAQIVKAPDDHLYERYKVWACITQFDAATGLDTFRANASYQKETYWVAGVNSFFVGDQDQLAEYVAGDVLSMNVVALGSFSYDTQAGGNTTVPLFRVDEIPQSQSGAC